VLEAQRAFEEAEAALRARRAAEAAGQAAVQEEAEQLEPAALAEATVEDAADVPVAAEIPVLDDAAVELDADLGEATRSWRTSCPRSSSFPRTTSKRSCWRSRRLPSGGAAPPAASWRRSCSTT